MGLCPQDQQLLAGGGRKQDGQRGKLNFNAGTTKASVHATGSSEAKKVL